jgi:hypothetical protein
VDRDIIISFCGTLLVIEAQCMEQLVFDCAQPEAPDPGFVGFKVQLLALQ